MDGGAGHAGAAKSVTDVVEGAACGDTPSG